jgi:octaprenyl-diphosphate synthase
MKTAALFAAATELGARLNGQAAGVQAALKSYGMKLGTAYQIYDDCLDLVGDEKTVGKTLGTDLRKGKLTLPMLYLLESATTAQKQKLSKMLITGEPMDASILAGIADYVGSIERAVGTAAKLLREADDDLDCLPPSPHREALLSVTAYLQNLLDKCRAVA